MGQALALAREAAAEGEVPVGAVVVGEDGTVLRVGHNQREQDADPTAHAEVLALREAGARRGTWNLQGCTLVVTVEPCTMCAAAAVAARVSRVVFGVWEPKTGACGSVRDVVRDVRSNHQVEVVPGVCGAEAAELMEQFFLSRREALSPKSPLGEPRTLGLGARGGLG